MPRRRSVATKWKLEGAERRPERRAETVGARFGQRSAGPIQAPRRILSTPTLAFSLRRYRAGGRAGDNSMLLRRGAVRRLPRLPDRPAYGPPAAPGDSRAPTIATARQRAAARCGRPG